MTVSRGVASILLSVLGVAILLGVIFLVASLLGSNAPVKPIIIDSIELRKAQDPVQKARLISELDDLITQSKNNDLKEQWDRMTQCLGTSCPDEAYLDLVLVTVSVYEKELPESPLLINIIAVAKYWGDQDHLLDFSKALAAASDQIDLLKNKNVRKTWEQVVSCNNTCPEKNDLFFELILAIVQ